MGKKVWAILLNALISAEEPDGFKISKLADTANNRVLKEIPWISTNFAAQWSLNVIQCLEFIQDLLPETLEKSFDLLALAPPDTHRRS